MASTIRLLATQMEDMENSFLSIFFESANKIAELTQSKLFVVMETSDGLRRIGGDPEMRRAFQLGTLRPRPSDVEVDEEENSRSSHKSHTSSMPEREPLSRKRKSLERYESNSSKYSRGESELEDSPEDVFVLEDVKLKNLDDGVVDDGLATAVGVMDDHDGDFENEAVEEEEEDIEEKGECD